MVASAHRLRVDELFAMARQGSLCELVGRVNRFESPPPEAAALRVYALLRSGDAELAFVRLAQLMEGLAASDHHGGGLRRWISAPRPWRASLDPAVGAVEEFYRHWNVTFFWRSLTATIMARELDFIANVLHRRDDGFRILVAVADSFRLRQELHSAWLVYVSMCRIRRTPELLHNVYTLAVQVDPATVAPMLEEFSGA